MKIHTFLDAIVHFMNGHRTGRLKQVWAKFLQTKVKLSAVLLIIASSTAIIAFIILFGSTAIAGAKFDADKEALQVQIADQKNINKDYKDQYQNVLKLKNEFRSSIKDIVQMLYNKDTYLAVGGSSIKVADSDEAVLLQLRSAVDTMGDDQKWLGEVKDYLVARQDFIQNFPFVWPTLKSGIPRITSGYGFRPDPFNEKKLSYHAGIDIAGNPDDPVFATADGVVVEIGTWGPGQEGQSSDYGNFITVRHKYSFETRYAHLDKVLVTMGQHIKRGDKIGQLGNTGMATGYHLHYEIRKDGVAIDPMSFLTVNY